MPVMVSILSFYDTFNNTYFKSRKMKKSLQLIITGIMIMTGLSSCKNKNEAENANVEKDDFKYFVE
jgi:hypothetical protein